MWTGPASVTEPPARPLRGSTEAQCHRGLALLAGASGSLRTQQRAWITSSFVHVSGCTQLYFLERLEVATDWSVFHP